MRIDSLIRFIVLKGEWEDEMANLSSITEISMHPAYQQIIGMGKTAIPYILYELSELSDEKPSYCYWFWALKSITGEDPVTGKKPILDDQKGNIKEMAKAWLKWGKHNGYRKIKQGRGYRFEKISKNLSNFIG